MKTLQLLTVILFTSTLMGCQLEVTPIGDEAISGNESTSSDSANDARGEEGTGNENGNDDETVVDEEIVDTGETVTSSVTLYWSAPLDRVNGDNMPSAEIGGYEVRYKKAEQSSYINVLINDASVDQLVINGVKNAESYTFQVAVFDNNGIYSEFITAAIN